MSPHDNWYPALTDEPGWYWSYVDFVDTSLFEVQQLIDESEVDVDEYGYDGWDFYLDRDDEFGEVIIIVSGTGTRDNPIDLTQ